MDLKRDLVKYVRDKAKSGYQKDTQCFICGDAENLEFHHFYGMTELLHTWLKGNKITITSADEIMKLREQFIEEHLTEVYDEAATLCKTHHIRLHSIYGKRPKLASALKQKRWVEIQRDKYGMV
jgi:hypothetical protein|tara:strand:+ start:243 stop:614 length:372 start_codon:yes stop_codon:yes gene_type:complete